MEFTHKARPRVLPLLAAFVVLTMAAAACQQKAAPTKIVGRVDPVVSRVNGFPIFRSDVEREARGRGLDPLASAPGSTAYAVVLDELIDRKLLAQEAAREGLDHTLDGRRRLEAAREQVLSNLMLESRLRGAVTEARVDGLYAEMVKARGPSAPPETLDQARPRIIRFLTFDRIKDLVLDLRHKAKIFPPPAPIPATPPTSIGSPKS